jgi:hypothetical protein
MTEPKYHAPSANLTFETPVTKSLSPAALAAYNSFHGAADGEYVDGVWVTYSNRMIAAALRAVADEVVPFESEDILGCWYEKKNPTREALLDIASELEEFQ